MFIKDWLLCACMYWKSLCPPQGSFAPRFHFCSHCFRAPCDRAEKVEAWMINQHVGICWDGIGDKHVNKLNGKCGDHQWMAWAHMLSSWSPWDTTRQCRSLHFSLSFLVEPGSGRVLKRFHVFIMKQKYNSCSFEITHQISLHSQGIPCCHQSKVNNGISMI